MSSRTYDFVIFGATGFTGRRLVDYAAKYIHEHAATYRWAIAGRDRTKLEKIVQEVKQLVPTAKCDVLVADVNDASSLSTMCQSAKVAIDCVGPFRLYGEPVVKACVEHGTHYVDITGEPSFIENMMVKYHTTAESNRALIVTTCGFDSIPADIGVLYTRRAFADKYPNGTLQSVDSYLTVTGGFIAHYGTWESLIHGLTHQHELASIRKQLRTQQERDNTKPIRPVGGKPSKPKMMFYHKELKQWAMLFPGADASVVKNSEYYLQRHASEAYKSFPYYGAYFLVPNVFWVFMFVLFGAMLSVMVKFNVTRQWLLKYPELFTLGRFSHAGPSESIMQNTRFLMHFYATGTNGERLHTLVEGPEPGYVATPIAVLQSAITILEGTKKAGAAKLPAGGVVTPASAFHQSDLIDRLQAEGISFRVVQ